MLRWRNSLIVTAFLLGLATLGWGAVARADVPKPEDVATCNGEAKEAVRKGSAAPSTPAPTATDERRAADQRRRDAPRAPGAQASDPQIEGMDAQGAKNPMYQAAYRTCMRKNGY